MELAKIRNKARQEEAKAPDVPDVAGLPLDHRESPTERLVSPPATGIPMETPDAAIAGGETAGAAPSRLTQQSPPDRFDPLALILAGRQADQEEAQEAVSDARQMELDAGQQYQEFLCFLVGDEEYGINIMEIKELIKPRTLTEVPRAPHFVDGIISLRGMIVPVIDLRKRLGLDACHLDGQQRVIIVRCGDTLSGLRVDMVTGVLRIEDQRREMTPAILEGIDRAFVAGIGRSDNRMVILLDVQNVVDFGPFGEA